MTATTIEWNDNDDDYIEAANIGRMALIFIDGEHAVFDGGFSIEELEQIISKMKELQEHKNARNN